MPCQIADSHRMFQWVQDLFRMGIRRPATEADARAERYIAQKLREFGIEDVRMDPIEIMGWEGDVCTLEVLVPDAQGLTLEPIPAAYSPFTRAEGKPFRLSHVGKGTQEEVRGKGSPDALAVVEIDYGTFPFSWVRQLAYLYHDPHGTLSEDYVHVATWLTSLEEEIYERCEREGFGGLVLIHPFDLTAYLCTPQSEPLEGTCGPIPMCVLRRSDGKRLREWMENGAMNARLTMTGRTFWGTMHNVLGFLPGKSPEVILVSSHHDAMWKGATEDASGVAVVLAMAEYFASLPLDRREKTLVFNLEAAEQLHVIGGTKLMEMHGEDIFDRLVVDVHIEHIAKETIIGPDGHITVTDQVQPRAIFVSEVPELREAVERMVLTNDLERTAVLPTNTPLGVQTDAIRFAEAGYPIISFISAPAYWNASEDTLDKVPVEELGRVAKAFARLIEEDLFYVDGSKVIGRTWNQQRLS